MKHLQRCLMCGIGLIAMAQAPSSIVVSGKAGEEAIEIRNLGYEVAGPEGARLVLRKTEQTRQLTGDKGMEAMTVLEAWPLRADRKQKPLYSIRVKGVDGRTMDNALFVVARGLEDVQWWSVYRLSDGKPLFDTHVKVVRFSTSRDVQALRYAGFEVPEDGDSRLKRDDRLIGVLHYSTEDRELRQLEFRCDDAQRARLLRSYWDVSRTLEFVPVRRALVLTIQEANPNVTVEIPLDGNDLAVGRVKAPAEIRVVSNRAK